jgi:hypothetical protein
MHHHYRGKEHDKLKQGELTRQKRVLTAALNECGHAGEPLLFSSVKGTGRRELMERVFAAAGLLRTTDSGSVAPNPGS